MDLCVDDEYIQDFISNQCEQISEYIGEYADILKTISESGLLEGKTADSFKEFKEQVKSGTEISNSTFESLGEKCERYSKDFITKIDAVDKDLY